MTHLPDAHGGSRLTRGLGPLGLVGSLLLHGAVMAALVRLPLPATPPAVPVPPPLTVGLLLLPPSGTTVTPTVTPADPRPEPPPVAQPKPAPDVKPPRADAPRPVPARRKPTAAPASPPNRPSDTVAVAVIDPTPVSPVPVETPPPEPEPMLTEPMLISAPRFRHRPPPAYPLQARRDELEGIVRLKLLIDPSGAVASAIVVRSSGHRVLDQAALTAAHQWRLDPERHQGTPVPAWAEVDVPFRLID